MYYTIFTIYYLSDSPSSLITESVCLVGKGRLKERCGLEPRTNFGHNQTTNLPHTG